MNRMKPLSCNKPFSPARWPFFYGWAIVGFGTLGIVASSPGQTIGVSTFTDHLIEAVRLSRTQISLAYMFGTICSALLLTRAGRAYDRYGARVLGPVTCVGLGLVLLLLSQCDRVAGALTRLTGVEGAWSPFVVLLLGFFALRFTGQGVLTMASRNMLLKWFDRRRGLVVGISGVCVSLAMSLSPRVFDAMIESWSWRAAWQVTGVVLGVGVAGLALIFYRDNPEQCGLVPDGTDPPPSDDASVHTARRAFTLSEARRCYTFWVFALTLAMFGLYITGVTFHVVDIFDKAGMTRDQAVAIFFPTSVFSVGLRLLMGWASDYIRLKYVLMVMLVGLLAGMLGMIFLSAGWTVWLLIAGNGCTMALMGLISGVAWPRFFGRKHLGAISGMAMAMTVFASALGPYLFSQSLKWTGSYRTAGWACLVVTLLLLVGSLRAENPQRSLPAEEDSEPN